MVLSNAFTSAFTPPAPNQFSAGWSHTIQAIPGIAFSQGFTTNIAEVGGGGFGPGFTLTINTAYAGINNVQFEDDTLSSRKFAPGAFSADDAGRNLIEAGFFSADAAGRAKFADGFFTPSMLDRAYQEPLTEIVTTRHPNHFKVTDEPSPPLATVAEDEVPSFENGVTQEIKVGFVVPLLKSGSQNLSYSLRFAASTTEPSPGNFRLSIEYRRNGGAVIGPTLVNIMPNSTADLQKESGSILVLTPGNAAAGDRILLKVKRLGADPADTHGGELRVHEVIQRAPL